MHAPLLRLAPDQAVVEKQEINALRLLMGQAILVMTLAERELDPSDSLAFEARAMRSILEEHFPHLTLPPAPEE